ncbi:MAG: 2'-5' RNA ligase family protein [Dehalococcoidia bacterium]
MASRDEVKTGEKVFGVVSLLDGQTDEAVRRIWGRFERELGLPPVADTNVPHFSYAVAEQYEMGKLDAALLRLAASQAPFSVQTEGIFSFMASPQAMSWLPIAASSTLKGLHQRVWDTVVPLSTGNMDRYQPEGWLPHIALTPDGLTTEVLPVLAGILGREHLAWTITVNNFALIRDSSSRQAVDNTWRFGGGAKTR